jgi:hypothetical protein
MRDAMSTDWQLLPEVHICLHMSGSEPSGVDGPYPFQLDSRELESDLRDHGDRSW